MNMIGKPHITAMALAATALALTDVPLEPVNHPYYETKHGWHAPPNNAPFTKNDHRAQRRRRGF